MARKGEQNAELERLRREVSELRAKTPEGAGGSRRESEEPAPEADSVGGEQDSPNEEWQETIAELEGALSEFSDRAGKEISQRPIMAVVGAFVLGILVGRLLSR